jgi:hypothetical protein
VSQSRRLWAKMLHIAFSRGTSAGSFTRRPTVPDPRRLPAPEVEAVPVVRSCGLAAAAGEWTAAPRHLSEQNRRPRWKSEWSACRQQSSCAHQVSDAIPSGRRPARSASASSGRFQVTAISTISGAFSSLIAPAQKQQPNSAIPSRAYREASFGLRRLPLRMLQISWLGLGRRPG